ncbi:hypothetical protein PGB90_001695 [Kerria lacca]
MENNFYRTRPIIGGVFFAKLEAPIEENIRKKIMEKRANFLKIHSCVSNSELEEFIQEIIRGSERGISIANNSNNSSRELNWSFAQSLFFCSTIVTTIGYGHITPLSKEGKIFCMVYALLGIPLTLILLTAMVERLMIPSVLFLNIESDWDYLDSLYYSFISLTTIGLGDYIPGNAPYQKYRSLYKVVISGYLIVGLMFMMFCLKIFYDIPQFNVGIFFTMQTDEKTNDPEKIYLKASETNLLKPNYVQNHSKDLDILSNKTVTPKETTPVYIQS